MWSGWWLFSMPWLLSATFITQLTTVQDQEVFSPLGWGSCTLEGCRFFRQAYELLSQTTNPSFVDYYYYYYSPNQYQGVGGERRRRDKSTDSAVMNNNVV